MSSTRPKALELCCGSKSFSKTIQTFGFDTVTLDIDPKFCPDICANILTWDYANSGYFVGEFAVIWMSPPCTEYSIAKSIGIRDLMHADSIVVRMIEILSYFRPLVYVLENPQTGLLKSRGILEYMKISDVTYCKYGCLYKKKTRLWSNIELRLQPPCSQTSPCAFHILYGKHPANAQRSSFPVEILYHIPQKLIQEICIQIFHYFVKIAK